MGNATLYEPDITPVLDHVYALMLSRGIAPQGGFATAPSKTTQWMVGGNKLDVFWSHMEQRVMLCYPKAVRTGKFRHVSQVENPSSYYTRIKDWIVRNVEFSYPLAPLKATRKTHSCGRLLPVDTPQPKRGRPPVRGGNNPLPGRKFGRVSDADWQEIRNACELSGLSLVQWALPMMLKKARREKSK